MRHLQKTTWLLKNLSSSHMISNLIDVMIAFLFNFIVVLPPPVKYLLKLNLQIFQFDIIKFDN